jgi:uncharacterized phage-like protein YoqJ
MNSTVAFTGHRKIDKSVQSFLLKELIDCLDVLIKNNCDTFISGMALGFDQIVVKELIERKKVSKINIIAALPCKNQEMYWNDNQKQVYYEFLKNVDKIVYVSDNYDSNCMFKRNQWMVDNCGLLVAAYNGTPSGTRKTINYAKNKKIPIINLWPVE